MICSSAASAATGLTANAATDSACLEIAQGLSWNPLPVCRVRSSRQRPKGILRVLGGLLLGIVAISMRASKPLSRLAAVAPHQSPGLILPRRDGIMGVASAGVLTAGAPAWAEQVPREEGGFTASWAATDGVEFLTDYSPKVYAAMRDDTKRTPLFIKAIRQRVSSTPGCTVVDIGTGPFALFALVAVRAGAKKVYAIEANPEVVAEARDFVEKAEDIPAGAIEIIEGFSTAVKLPEKVDLLVAEICGAITSEENHYDTIRDAQKRFLKLPYEPASYVPYGASTFCAPVSYALHPILAPPRYEQLKGMPLRVNCLDRTLQLLAEPQLFESVRYCDKDLPAGKWVPKTNPFTFTVSAERLKNNEEEYFNALKEEAGADLDECRATAKSVANTFSGMAFWPRLTLDQAETVQVESRGPTGEATKSHWPTVLALMSPFPRPASAGDVIEIKAEVEFQRQVIDPGKYSLEGTIRRAKPTSA